MRLKIRMTTCLFLPDALEELQHGKSRVRGAVVRPTCELQTTLLAFLLLGMKIWWQWWQCDDNMMTMMTIWWKWWQYDDNDDNDDNNDNDDNMMTIWRERSSQLFPFWSTWGFRPHWAGLRTPALSFDRCTAPVKLPASQCPRSESRASRARPFDSRNRPLRS